MDYNLCKSKASVLIDAGRQWTNSPCKHLNTNRQQEKKEIPCH